MIQYEIIAGAQNTLIDLWGEDGKKVIEACFNSNTKEMTTDEFLDNCIACGGNWGGMFLSGIERLYPAVYDAIPDQMGSQAILGILAVLTLCKIDS
jgi:hypothetical protein